MSAQTPQTDKRAEMLVDIAPRTCALMKAHIRADADRRVSGEPATAKLIMAEMMEMRDLCYEVEAEGQRLKALCEELREALAPFAAMKLSFETTTSDLLYRTPAEGMRHAAEAIERKDTEIRAARAALKKAEKP